MSGGAASCPELLNCPEGQRIESALSHPCIAQGECHPQSPHITQDGDYCTRQICVTGSGWCSTSLDSILRYLYQCIDDS